MTNDRFPDKRTAYRVRAAPGDSDITLGLASGPLAARLADVSALGCSFIVPESHARELQPDTELVLRMRIGGPRMPKLFLRGVVRSQIEESGGLRVGVQFVDTDRLYNQLREPQWRFFNRRQAFRVPPADERGRPVRAKFELPGEHAPRSVQLHDLSSTGLAISIRPVDDFEVPTDEPIYATFSLPGVPRSLELTVRFVHRRHIEGRIRVGFRIDMIGTLQAEEQCEMILRYVLERQRQILLAA